MISEDRISHLAHVIVESLWKSDVVDFPDEGRALNAVKDALTRFFSASVEIDEAVRKKLKGKIPGSRDWEILYSKFYQEEAARRNR